MDRKYDSQRNAWFYEKPCDNISKTTFGSLENVRFGFCDYELKDICGRKFGLHMHLRSADINGVSIVSIFYMPNSEDIEELLNQLHVDSVDQLEGRVVEILKKDFLTIAGFRVNQNLLATVSK